MIQQMTAKDFKNKVFNYEMEDAWNYKGELPAIIDFYADWCGPCKGLALILEELSDAYKDKLIIYKIDTEKERELSSLFGIQSIPTLLFIPLARTPMMQKGALPKKVLKEIIEEKLIAQSVGVME